MPEQAHTLPPLGESRISEAREMAERWLGADPRLSLLGHRENTVFRATSASGASIALRLPRTGYNDLAELKSEIAWLEHLHQSSVPVARPVPALDGQYLHQIPNQSRECYASASAFVKGEKSDAVFAGLDAKERVVLWTGLGATIARMHNASDTFKLDTGLRRRQWYKEELLGPAPHWGPFWLSSLLSERERDDFLFACIDLGGWLGARDERLDKGLIHCDLNPDNLLWRHDGDRWGVSFIDFDDGGLGYRVYELAIALFSYFDHRSFADYCEGLFKGYRRERELDVPTDADLKAYMAIRALSLFGWVSGRLDDCADPSRPMRSLSRAKQFVEIYQEAHKERSPESRAAFEENKSEHQRMCCPDQSAD